MSDTNELLPCPFCGGPARCVAALNNDRWWIVYCTDLTDPGCPARTYIGGMTEEVARAAWNRRAPLAAVGAGSVDSELLRRIVATYDDCEGNRGWLSCVADHDGRCSKGREINDVCECSADEMRAAIEAARLATRTAGEK